MTEKKNDGRGRSLEKLTGAPRPALMTAAGYYVGARLGFALTLQPVPVSTLWPPNAILLAGLLLTPTRTWPLTLAAVFGAHLAVQFQSGVPIAMVLCWFVSNCSEALIGAGLLRRFRSKPLTFDTIGNAASFLAAAGFAAPFLSSFVDAGFVVMNEWGDGGYWIIWRTRFFSNVLAELTLVPFIVTTAQYLPCLREAPRRKLLELFIGALVLATVCWVVFVYQKPGPGALPVLLYAPVPILVAAAVQFGPWGASTSAVIYALIAISGAVVGQGPFVTSSPTQNALSIQLFLIVASIPVMVLAAVIREREHADVKARHSEEELAIAIDAAQLGRWEWDFATRRLTWSDITRRIYEVPPDETVTPETFEALIHPDDRGLVQAATAKGLGGGGIDVEFRIKMPDGRVKWILSKGKTVYDAQGRPVQLTGVKMDVTERKLAEMRIQEQQRRLAHLARVTEAGELSIALAHEVNQPLAAILANAGAARRFLLRDPPDLRELGEIVEAIAHDNRRAAAVVTRFGDLLKKPDAPRARLDINEVVATVVEMVRGDAISRGVSLTVRLARGLPHVPGNAVELQQVVLNLIVNGCDAMEEVAAGMRRLLITTRAEQETAVRVTVRDFGPGIPNERLEDMFEPFVTSKPRRLGLGLAICRSIVSAHGGILTAENVASGGATFSFTIAADASVIASVGTEPMIRGA